jgi:hypothetical protein
MTAPRRIQLERRRGFDLQATSRALNGLPAQIIARPSKWGNPFTIADVAAELGLDTGAAQAEAVGRYRRWVMGEAGLLDKAPPARAEIVAELAGKNLACWCKPGTPCHADILLDIANGRGSTE